MKIAYLGLGIMGRPMAANLVKAGHEVDGVEQDAEERSGRARGSTPAEPPEMPR